MSEVILPRRAHAQPSPRRVAVGDCGACVLGGLLGRSVDEAYAIVRDDGQPRSIDWYGMRQTLVQLAASGTLSRVMVDVPLWPHAVPSMCLTWGLSASWQSHAWQSYAATAIDAGLYGLACVSSAAAGPDSAGPDHWVLIVGYRRHVEAHHLRDDLLVSCSAQHPEGRWVPRSDFLRGCGGFNALWARPS